MIDNLLSAIAPHACISCDQLGSVLCVACRQIAGQPPEPRCAGCKVLQDNYKTCRSCRSWLNIASVFVATEYEGIDAHLLKAYKFQLKRQAAAAIADIMAQLPLSCSQAMVLCPLPTASVRIRQRGFDHIRILARAYAEHMRESTSLYLTIDHVLGRTSNTRQLGSSRRQRIEQMKHEFYVSSGAKVRDKVFLLLDDVTTTGASLAAAAQTLKEAGAKQVYAIVYAQKV